MREETGSISHGERTHTDKKCSARPKPADASWGISKRFIVSRTMTEWPSVRVRNARSKGKKHSRRVPHTVFRTAYTHTHVRE